jgi:hypothetical protein
MRAAGENDINLNPNKDITWVGNSDIWVEGSSAGGSDSGSGIGATSYVPSDGDKTLKDLRIEQGRDNCKPTEKQKDRGILCGTDIKDERSATPNIQPATPDEIRAAGEDLMKVVGPAADGVVKTLKRCARLFGD